MNEECRYPPAVGEKTNIEPQETEQALVDESDEEDESTDEQVEQQAEEPEWFPTRGE